MSKQNDFAFWKGIPHCRIRFNVLQSPAWRCLSASAKALYVDLRGRLYSCNNGNISCTLTQMKHHGWNSSGTLHKALYELQALGFLVITRRGGVERGSKVCNLYAFTDIPIQQFEKLGIQGKPETLGHASYTSVAEAKKALNEGVSRLREESKKRKQKKNDAAKIEQVGGCSGSKIEQVGYSSCSKIEQVGRVRNVA